METQAARIGRRAFLGRLGVGTAAIGAVLAGCDLAGPPQQGTPTTAAGAAPGGQRGPASPDLIRLGSVVIPQESGLYAELLPEFERRSGYRVEVTTAHKDETYAPARAGKFDIVLSHYQHESVAQFMEDSFGEWPRLVFASSGAVIGPPNDPAEVRGAADIAEAFRRIAKARLPFVVNDIDGLRYVSEVARQAAELTAGSLYLDKGTKGPEAMRAAVQSGGYTMWGVVPFLRQQQLSKLALEPLLTRDQLLKSVMVTIVVNGGKVEGVNTKGARALQHYLIESATQAKIRTFRMAGIAEQVWWPAAHDNGKAAFAQP